MTRAGCERRRARGLAVRHVGVVSCLLPLIENRTLDGHIQELIYRPAVH